MRLPTFATGRTAVELQLTPMIDCVFLLMVYFIWSSSFRDRRAVAAEPAFGPARRQRTVGDPLPEPSEDFETW